MNERQLNEMLQQLEQDPLLPLSPEQLQELYSHSGNSRVSELLRFIKEQQETDRVLREQFSLLKEELAKVSVPAPPSVDGLVVSGSRNVLFYALPVAAMLAVAVTVFLWQKPKPSTQGEELALQVPEKQQEGGDAFVSAEKSTPDTVGARDSDLTKFRQKSSVKRQEQLLAQKEEVSGGSAVPEISGMADPVGSIMTRSTTPEFDSSGGETSAALSREEQLKLRRKADQLWKAVRENPQDEKSKAELHQILEKLGDKEGLRQLSMY